MRSLALLLAAATLLTIVPAASQATPIDLSLYGGYYAPQSNVLDVSTGRTSILQAAKSEAPGLGGALTIWLNDRIGLQGSAFYSDGTVTGQILNEEVGEMGATSFFGGGRVVLGLGGKDGRPNVLQLSAGLMYTSLQYELVDGATHGSGVLGAALHLPVSPSVGLRLGVDDYIYDVWWVAGDARTDPLRQHDVVATVGLTFFTGR